MLSGLIVNVHIHGRQEKRRKNSWLRFRLCDQGRNKPKAEARLRFIYALRDLLFLIMGKSDYNDLFLLQQNTSLIF